MINDKRMIGVRQTVVDQQGSQTGGRGSDRSALESVASGTSEGVNSDDDGAKKNTTSHSTEATKRTWADVVKFSSPQQVANRNKIVSGSFSRNNTDCKTKV